MSELSLSYGSGDVEVETRETVFKGYFRMDALTLRHRRFDGSWTDGIRREMFERGDAVAVLPWHVESDKVILIEQFRPGAIRGDDSPWMLEADHELQKRYMRSPSCNPFKFLSSPQFMNKGSNAVFSSRNRKLSAVTMQELVQANNFRNNPTTIMG